MATGKYDAITWPHSPVIDAPLDEALLDEIREDAVQAFYATLARKLDEYYPDGRTSGDDLSLAGLDDLYAAAARTLPSYAMNHPTVAAANEEPLTESERAAGGGAFALPGDDPDDFGPTEAEVADASTGGASAGTPDLEVGARVRLRHDVDRYPHFMASEGALGTVVDVDGEIFGVRLDQPLPGAEEWHNEVHWIPGMHGDPAEDLEVLPRRTLTASFDVTGMTPAQISNLRGYVQVQAEESNDDDAEDARYSGVPVEITVDPPLPEPEPRTILVHVNVELPADAPATAADVEAEVERAILLARDLSTYPALTVGTVCIPLAEEV